MPTLEFQAIVNSLKSAIFTPGNLVTVSAVTTVANIPVLDLTVNQIDTDSFTLDETTDPPTLRITAHPEQSPWHSNIDAAGFYLYDIPVIQFADGSVQTTAFNAAAIGQTPWLSDIDAAGYDLSNVAVINCSGLTVQQNDITIQQGALNIIPSPGANAFRVYDSSASLLRWYIDTSGNLFAPQHNGISDIGSIRFADNSVQTTAYLGIAASQTPWQQNIDGNGHALANVSQLILQGVAGIFRFGVLNEPGTAWDWQIDTSGNLTSGSQRTITGLGLLGFADGTTQTTAYKGIAASQTPWLQDIDAAGHALLGVSDVFMQTGGAITNIIPGTLSIVPQPGTGPLNIYNSAGSAQDWFVDVNGNLSSNTGRNITTTGTLYGSTLGARGGYCGVMNAAGDVWVGYINDLGTFIGGSIQVQDAYATRYITTGVGVVIDATGAFVGPGVSTARGTFSESLFAEILYTPSHHIMGSGASLGWSINSNPYDTVDTVLGRDGPGAVRISNLLTGKAIMFHADGGVRLSNASTIHWSSTANYGDVADVGIRRHSAGVITLYNPQTTLSANLEFGSDCGLRVVTLGSLNGFEVYNVSTLNGAPFKCLGLTSTGEVSATNGYTTGGGVGKYGSFTTADGKTVTVNGGIIIGIA